MKYPTARTLVLALFNMCLITHISHSQHTIQRICEEIAIGRLWHLHAQPIVEYRSWSLINCGVACGMKSEACDTFSYREENGTCLHSKVLNSTVSVLNDAAWQTYLCVPNANIIGEFLQCTENFSNHYHTSVCTPESMCSLQWNVTSLPTVEREIKE